MTTTLQANMQELSKQLGDTWQGTATSNGAADGTTIIDTAMKAKANDWVTLETYDFITSGTYNGEERKVSTLDNSTGTATMLAHTGQILSAVTYEIHRLFTPSEKRRALIYAARHGFPYIYQPIRDQSIVSGNWLKDGSFEVWTTSTNLTYWLETTVTATQITTPLWAFKHGTTSCKLSTLAGRISQGLSEFEDLKQLAGESVTFSVQGHCDTASCLRIGIYDGDKTTYSSYHDGDSAWTPDNDPLEVTATIPEDPDSLSFRIFHDVAAGVSYVDDARVMGPKRGKLWIGDIGIAQDKPHQIFIEPSDYYRGEPWLPTHNWESGTDGYVYLPDEVPSDYRLRILGMGYLDFLASGVSSTAWTSTIYIDSPQTEILIAEAALYLCKQMVMPNYTPGDNKAWQAALLYWQEELKERRRKYAMKQLAATVHWR